MCDSVFSFSFRRSSAELSMTGYAVSYLLPGRRDDAVSVVETGLNIFWARVLYICR